MKRVLAVKAEKSRRPGRPVADAAGEPDMREHILDVAEQLFADVGFDAASMRDIASGVGVNPALITYYFGSKQSLFETVYKRRGLLVSAQRIELLEALEARATPPTARELIAAFLSPQFTMKESGPGGLAFVKLQGRLHNGPEDFAFKLRREVYDESTKRYIAALERALPKIDPADISWRMMFLIGTYLYMLAGVDRLRDLSSGRFSADSTEELVARLTQFITGGMTAPSTEDAPGLSVRASPRR